jgi:hypothetical protein
VLIAPPVVVGDIVLRRGAAAIVAGRRSPAGFPRAGSVPDRMALRRAVATVEGVNEVLAERIAWRRRSVRRHYVGTLSGDTDALHLAGREPGSGIEVSLSIPLREIDRVRVSGAELERVVGEPAVVLEFSDSEPILLREIGVGHLRPKALAARLEEALT